MGSELTVSLIGDGLAGTAGVVSAYLFGSTAHGRTHRESDVDIGVLLDRAVYPSDAERFDLRLRLIARLQSALRREVDLVILNDVTPHLARDIMTMGTPIVVVVPELDHAHRRLMMSRAADLEPFLRRARGVKLRAIAR